MADELIPADVDCTELGADGRSSARDMPLDDFIKGKDLCAASRKCSGGRNQTDGV